MEASTRNRSKSLLQILRDDRNGWIICLSCIVINMIRSGITYTFGLYIAELRKLYGSPMTELNWISVMVSSLSYLLSPFASFFVRLDDRRGHALVSLAGVALQAGACLVSSFVTRVPWLLLTFGLTYGVGCNMVLIASTLVMDDFFPAEHGCHEFATSIIQCAFPAGLLMFASIYAWLIETFSWRWSLRVAAAKTFVVGTACSLLLLIEKPNFTGKKIEKPKKKNICHHCLEIFQRPERMCWILGESLIFACQIVVVNNLPHYLEEKGFKPVETSFSISTIGVAELFVYCVIPFLGNSLRGRLPMVNILSSFLFAVLFLVWPISRPSYHVVLVYSGVFGLCGASTFAFMFPATLEVMEMDATGAWTITCSGIGVGCLVGPFISGLVFDLSGSYDIVFELLSGVCFLNLLLFSAIPLARWRRRRSYETLT